MLDVPYVFYVWVCLVLYVHVCVCQNMTLTRTTGGHFSSTCDQHLLPLLLLELGKEEEDQFQISTHACVRW